MSLRITKPMSIEEVTKISDEEGYFQVEVVVDLDDVIECSGCDGFLDILNDLVAEGWLLSDIVYGVVGAQDGDIVMNVEAFVEDFSSKFDPDTDPEDDNVGSENAEWDALT